MTGEHVDEIIDYIEEKSGRGMQQYEADQIKSVLFNIFGR